MVGHWNIILEGQLLVLYEICSGKDIGLHNVLKERAGRWGVSDQGGNGQGGGGGGGAQGRKGETHRWVGGVTCSR